MSGELEAAGAAATAGLAAGAIEGRSGGAAQEGTCPNCSEQLAGAYCAQCGQPADISRTLGDVVGDFLHALFHYDTKAWRTLPLLIARPGTLTHRYIHGQRARFVSPLATFLLAIFLMFFVFSLAGGPDIMRGQVGAGQVESLADAERALAQAQRDRDGARAALAKAEEEAAAIRARGGPGSGGEADGVLAGPQAEARVAERFYKDALGRHERAVKRKAALEQASKDIAKAEADLKTEALVVAGAAGRASKAAKNAVDGGLRASVGGAEKDDGDGRWQDRVREAAEKGEINVNTGWKVLDRRITDQLRNPDLALYKLQEVAYKYSFLLVPISLPFIALLFLWKRGVTLFDHVVFSLYSLSFMSLLFIALALIARLGDWTEPVRASLVGVAPPVHMFFHLKGTYALGWWSALWRTLLLIAMTFGCLLIFFGVVLVLGIFS
jgi:hypothetical protein